MAEPPLPFRKNREKLLNKLGMNSATRTRLLLLAILIFPAMVMALFWFFGKDPENPAATLPVMPPR